MFSSSPIECDSLAMETNIFQDLFLFDVEKFSLSFGSFHNYAIVSKEKCAPCQTKKEC